MKKKSNSTFIATTTMAGRDAHILGYNADTECYYGYYFVNDRPICMVWDQWGMCDDNFMASVSPRPHITGPIHETFDRLPLEDRQMILLNHIDGRSDCACEEFLEASFVYYCAMCDHPILTYIYRRWFPLTLIFGLIAIFTYAIFA